MIKRNKICVIGHIYDRVGYRKLIQFWQASISLLCITKEHILYENVEVCRLL